MALGPSSAWLSIPPPLLRRRAHPIVGPFEPTQLAVELLLSHQPGEERHLTADEVVVFVAIEVALRRVVYFLRLRTLPVRLTLRLSVDRAHSNVALCRHLNRGEPVGTTLCFCVSTGNGDALERTEEPRNRAAVMPLQHRTGLHQSQHDAGF